MAFDGHANFSYGTVTTAPSPGTSGTTVVIGTANFAQFPSPATYPYNVTIWPSGTIPLASNAEVARVVAKGTNGTLNLTRAQENSTNRGIIIGDQLAITITTKTITDIENLLPTTLTGAFNFNAPEGFLINGKIVPSVASNNLTLAIKGMDGNDPSASNPVYIRIGDTVRSITAALSVTINAGTKWMDSGGTMHATIEMDYFAYLGYNATDGVVVGFSRIPYATLYSDFSATTTAETYCAISTITNAVAGDNYVNIGRFAATLSAGAGYTWTVPTFTAINLVQQPIYETRWIAWIPTLTCSGAMTYTSTNNYGRRFMLRNRICYFDCAEDGTTGGTTSNIIYFSVPIALAATAPTRFSCAGYIYDAAFFGAFGTNGGNTDKIGCSKYNDANIGIGTFRDVVVSGFYEI